MDFNSRHPLPRHGVAVVVLLLGLSACNEEQRPVVSLDQARQVTAQFEGQSLAAPPRTISDITAILDQKKPDPAKAIAIRAAADEQPAEGLAGRDLADFYMRRADAATQIGRTGQRIDDFRTALALARSGQGDLSRTLQLLSDAEASAGNLKTAAILRVESVRVVPRDLLGRVIVLAASTAKSYTRMGDIDEANRWVREAEEMLAQLANDRGYPANNENWRQHLTAAKGGIAAARGQLTESETSQREAIRLLQIVLTKLPQMRDASPRAVFEAMNEGYQYQLARILKGQGRLVEAEVEARRALLGQLSRIGRDAPETGSGVWTLAMILMEQGRYPEAERLAQAAVDIYRGTGSTPGAWFLTSATMLVGNTQALQGRWPDAMATYDRMRRDLAGYPEEQRMFFDESVPVALALVMNGRAQEALPGLEKVVQQRIKTLGERNYETAETRGFHGMALAAAGQQARALTEFRAAIPILLQSSRQADDEETGAVARDQRLQLILESYIGLLADQPRNTEAVVESFRLADAARGRSVQRALAASSARANLGDPALVDLARREQDAQKQVSTLQGLLTNILASPPSEQEPAAILALRTQIDQLRSARAALREEIERRFPEYANLVDPRPSTADQARAALRPGEALIATYVGRDRSFVWAVPKDGPVAFAAVPLKAGDVTAMVGDLRKALDPNAATLGDIPAFDLALANRLYAAFLHPVAAGWQSASSLLVVPHGALGQLPFSLLVTEPATLRPETPGQALFANYKNVPWLARKAAITQLPSVASLATLRAMPVASVGRKPFVGFGDPFFNAGQVVDALAVKERPAIQLAAADTLQTRGIRLMRRSAPTTGGVDSAELGLLPRLPDTAEEVRNIAVALKADPAGDVFVGLQANERQVRTMNLADRKVVMFATHGLVPGDLNGLTQPALALSAPGLAKVEGDGLLTMDKILGLKLNADWVVLSACNTASGDGAGAEAVSGLGRAFFYAGTRALLVSNWPVETTSARELTTDLFRRQVAEPTLGRSQAMRQAMTAMIDGGGYVDQGKTIFSYAHPIFWAPFSVVGDGGGGAPGS